MPLITFTSDFGYSDYYVAKTKALIHQHFPEANIVDISHHIKPFDVTHMGYTLQAVYQDFPEGTIHLIGSDDTTFQQQEFVLVQVNGHYFVGPNNGVISLIEERPPSLSVKVDASELGFFTLAKTVALLAKGEDPEKIGEPISELKQFLQRKARATKKEISGHVIRVDHFGNLMTNIEKTDFDILSKDRKYTITFGREKVNRVNKHISEVEPGEVFFTFTSTHKLMLGINQGNGAQLLGLDFDSPIHISFDE